MPLTGHAPVSQRKGRGFAGLMGNGLQPLSKAKETSPPTSPKPQPQVKQTNSSKAPGHRPKQPSREESSGSQSNSSGTAGGQHGTVELSIVDGLHLPLSHDSQAYWLIDFDSEFSKTNNASWNAETNKPVWNATSTHDVALRGGKVLLYLYLVEPFGEQRLLGTAQIRLPEKLEDGRSQTHWLSFNCKESDELTGSVRVTSTFRKPITSRIGPKDFTILKQLGKGVSYAFLTSSPSSTAEHLRSKTQSFGTVFQVKKKGSGRAYAMKALSKAEIAERRMSPHVMSERSILQLTHLAAASPFLVGLKFSFQTKTHLYMVMDLKRGGELFNHLQNEGGRLSEDRVRFYTAELVLALETLHSHKVIFRDLKPENILLDEAGHICLCDFGLAKSLGTKKRTRTFCGTAEYVSPEMIESDAGYDCIVDWWSLGCLIFELICGFTPFYSEDNMDKYRKIVEADLRIPKRGFSPIVSDLINRLLNRDPKQRLGAQGADEVKAHPFFDPIDWKALAEQRVEPPFKPQVSDDPTEEWELPDDGLPGSLSPKGSAMPSSEETSREQTRRSSCRQSPASNPNQDEEHWWRDFTFAHRTASSRVSLASTAAPEEYPRAPSATSTSAHHLYQAFDEPFDHQSRQAATPA